MEAGITQLILFVAFGALVTALVLTLVRLFKGSKTSDRIVALDLVASIVMGFILLYSIIIEKPVFFDVAIVISLISFIGTVAISIYLKQKS